ncbi:YheC/YheD family protein [Alkaliphilus pronyensis]|uniref:YheC/YheD family protein n=1 Tax=Alkaliphilus pronyensis TaxID=1482732 RepID=A0A6I0FG11_9FIRM|nr:YheC/YheD family protein [Alkaliphilus pronyensis]KAB3537318.1 YheC/YheD family protein [Alkaliphilus pronyensis]
MAKENVCLSFKSRPIVGVLVGNSIIKNLTRQKETSDIEELKKANSTIDLTLYFFSINGINLVNKNINGIFFNQEKEIWQERIFPFPDIFYKRTSPPKDEKTSSMFEEQLKNSHIKPLNYLNKFNKWEVYTHLSKEEAFAEYLPKTIIYKSPADLQNILKLKNKVYLKACSSGRGKLVMRVVKLPNNRYQCSHYKNNLSIYNADNFKQLISIVLKFFKNKMFIVQESIDLITIDNRIVDLRAEVQKNGDGEITVAAIPVRIGRFNALITTHSKSLTFEDFFKNKMNYSSDYTILLKNRIEAFLKLTYQYLEKYYGPSGEIGIDIGIDKDGKLWFIECNSRSLKVSFHKAYDEKTVNQSYINLLDYAQYLYNKKT